jgi:hypothetical protein
MGEALYTQYISHIIISSKEKHQLRVNDTYYWKGAENIVRSITVPVEVGHQ